ncbi:MAG TPA: hypothetical protein VF883_24510 [Thermoanaerobaculia bacterium]|jgi:hypothetical protein
MVWLAAALFTVIAVAVYAGREPLARGQALIAGGRIGVGCVIAEAIGFLVLALLVLLFRDAF